MSRYEDTRKARLVRKERARILAELERGTRAIHDLLDAPPDTVGGADLWDVLLHVPKLGRSGIKQTCERAQVWPHHRLQDLTEDEVERLKAALPGRVG